MNKLKTLIVLIFLAAGCQSKKGPAESLKSFIDYRFEERQSKSELMDYVAGPLLEKIETMSETDFLVFSKMKDYQKVKFSITYKNCMEKKCFLTYILKYKKNRKASNEFTIEIKKVAELHQENEQWKIYDVKSIKSYYEAKVPLEVK